MTIDDAEQVHEWRNRAEIAHFMCDDRPIDLARHMVWIRAVLDSPACRYWIIEHEGRGVGVANLADIRPDQRRCAWAFYLADATVRGPIGVAVELRILEIVFGEMGFEKLTSEVLGFNERTIALHEKIGFVREGVLRAHVRRDDGVHDVVVLSMLRPEWEARCAPKRAGVA
jgi:UDP-4-amino-4,6-dideoxy-N-acetyl-beta-L-altrosamine N-acetyltransferase